MPKKIYNKELVFTGLILFVVIVSFPFWYNLGTAAQAPEPELTKEAKAAKQCVRPTEYIKREHMQLLDVWRDTVVRDATRIYVNEAGKEFDMSLSNTCLECHYNKEKFCDKCHDYASARPYCWDCHIEDPKETEAKEGEE